MQLQLDASAISSLRSALIRGGLRETGGQLFGRMHAPGKFSVTDVTTQNRLGSVARFLVDLAEALRMSDRFFYKRRSQYRTYNYIGEWHSHPSFAVTPSGTDLQTMRALVTDGSFRGSFSVLLIVRLDQDTITASASVFDRTGAMGNVQLEMCNA
ncbi:Mov34/MPN/PAD-1 family protein [Bacillus sp. NP157]|nr:Mov34/MPN/PAD-1 family protein [Bacillus sp. NP157]